MQTVDGFFCERYHELGLCPGEMVKDGSMPEQVRYFITAVSAKRKVSDAYFDTLCGILKLEPETALRHIKVTQNDVNLQRRYPNYYHPGVAKKSVKFRVSKIDALAREARRHSMDYGKYVGMLYLEQEQSVMDRYREYKLRRALGERLPE